MKIKPKQNETTDKQLKKINDKQEKVIDILPNLMYRNTISKCPL